MKTIAIIEHLPNDTPGFFATWMDLREIPYEVFRIHQGDQLPKDIQTHSGLCILGGAHSANDQLAYYPELFEQIRECIEQDIPVIGHCLGGQLMARALGATVQASENEEIGWSRLELINPLAASWFGEEKEITLFQWHGESFSIPSGSTQLIRGRYCANQAFLVGDMHLGMQFHCEVDEPKVLSWMELEAHTVHASKSPGVQSVQSVLATLREDILKSQEIASRIYTQWVKALKY